MGTWLAVNPINDFRIFDSEPEWDKLRNQWVVTQEISEGVKINPSNLATHIQDRGPEDNPIRLDI